MDDNSVKVIVAIIGLIGTLVGGFSTYFVTSKKQAIEDARFILPNACTTKMIVTMNARSLNNFFAHRCCMRAQWEIRELADQMLKLVWEVAPALFQKAGPSCACGACKEGKMSCGKAAEMKAKYAEIKK